MFLIFEYCMIVFLYYIMGYYGMGGSYFLYCLDLLCFIYSIIVYYTVEYYFDIVESKMFSRSNYAYTKLRMTY